MNLKSLPRCDPAGSIIPSICLRKVQVLAKRGDREFVQKVQMVLRKRKGPAAPDFEEVPAPRVGGWSN